MSLSAKERNRCVFNFLGDLKGELEGLISPFRLPRLPSRQRFQQAPKNDDHATSIFWAI
jgi:hypothetical protein